MRYGVAERYGSSRVREENRRLPQTLDFLDRVGRWPFFPEMDDDVFGAKWPPPWAIRAKAIAGGVPQGRRIP